MHPLKNPQSIIRKGQITHLLNILDLSRKVDSDKNLPLLLRQVAEEVAKLMDSDRASVFLLDHEKQELSSVITLDGVEIRIEARLGIVGAAVTTGQTINIEDAYNDPRFYRTVDKETGYRTRSVLVTPLKDKNGMVIGALQVLNKKDGIFTKDDEYLLEFLAEHLSTAIRSAQTIEELKSHMDQILNENERLRMKFERQFSTKSLIGTSSRILEVIRLIEDIRDSSLNVLITGESGTGKELVANAIHHGNSRANGLFVAINCASLPETRIESELFGIEKGVATGVEHRIGKFEEANRGTLFLDEIGDLSLEAQVKLIRAIQEMRISRVG